MLLLGVLRMPLQPFCCLGSHFGTALSARQLRVGRPIKCREDNYLSLGTQCVSKYTGRGMMPSGNKVGKSSIYEQILTIYLKALFLHKLYRFISGEAFDILPP